ASVDEPTVALPNSAFRSVAGAIESVTAICGTGAIVPVPLTAKETAGVAGSLLGILKVSVAGMIESGETKRTVNVQLPASGRVLPEHVSTTAGKLNGAA